VSHFYLPVTFFLREILLLPHLGDLGALYPLGGPPSCLLILDSSPTSHFWMPPQKINSPYRRGELFFLFPPDLFPTITPPRDLISPFTPYPTRYIKKGGLRTLPSFPLLAPTEDFPSSLFLTSPFFMLSPQPSTDIPQP